MTVAPIRPEIEAPVAHDFGYQPALQPAEEATNAVVKYENPLLLMLAWVLFLMGWLVGLVSIPCNWTLGALRVGWDSARRLGGI
jgi:hypothetical protein